VQVAQADAGAHDAAAFDLKRRLERAYRAARSVDAGAIAREHPDDIPGAIQRARLVAIATVE
jgi:HAMP domain-containing protein